MIFNFYWNWVVTFISKPLPLLLIDQVRSNREDSSNCCEQICSFRCLFCHLYKIKQDMYNFFFFMSLNIRLFSLFVNTYCFSPCTQTEPDLHNLRPLGTSWISKYAAFLYCNGVFNKPLSNKILRNILKITFAYFRTIFLC